MLHCPNCGEKLSKEVKFCPNCGTKVQDDDEGKGEETPKVVDDNSKDIDNEFNYAGFWKRLAAFIIDAVVLILMGTLILGTIMVVLVSAGYAFESESMEWKTFVQVVSIAVAWVYYAGMESSSKQATLGKILLGIIVTDQKGKSPSFLKVSIRHFAKFISSFIFCIGYLMIAFTRKKQGLHDIIAGCLVINKK